MRRPPCSVECAAVVQTALLLWRLLAYSNIWLSTVWPWPPAWLSVSCCLTPGSSFQHCIGGRQVQNGVAWSQSCQVHIALAAASMLAGSRGSWSWGECTHVHPELWPAVVRCCAADWGASMAPAWHWACSCPAHPKGSSQAYHRGCV